MSLIISHRGNLHGKHSCDENTYDAITDAIRLGFQVEVDVWVSGKNIFLGHDEPKEKISFVKIHEISANLFIHCKNFEALKFALSQKWRCFFHADDDYTIVSSGEIWKHPKTNQNDISEQTICVLPEENMQKKMEFSKYPKGFCTDFPLLFRFSKKINLQIQGFQLDKVYDSIQNRKDQIFIIDNFPKDDERRCIAVFSDVFGDFKFSRIIDLTKRIFSNHCCYDVKGDAIIHFTHMQVSSFQYCRENKITDQILGQFENLMLEVDSEVQDDPQEIIFHRALAVSNSIILVGYIDSAMLDWREKMRKRCSSHPFFTEPHAQDIIHSTLVRFTSLPEKDMIESALSEIRKHLPCYVGLGAKFLRSCSYRMGSEVKR